MTLFKPRESRLALRLFVGRAQRGDGYKHWKDTAHKYKEQNQRIVERIQQGGKQKSVLGPA